MDFNLLSLSGLAAGGVVAAVVAGWNHVKSFFQYLTSLLIVQAKFESGLIASAVIVYLKTHWKQLPSTRLSYDLIYREFKDGRRRGVPYRQLVSNTFFVSRNGGFVLISGHEISTLRFFCVHPDELIRQALTYEEQQSDKKGSDRNRFIVHLKMGNEKGYVPELPRARNIALVKDEPTPETESSYTTLIGIDKSFMYEESMFEQFQEDADPLKGLYYDEAALKHLEDAKFWKSQEKWYIERSIPWRRGSLFYGPGGTGKSSLAKATAKVLNVPLYSFMLSTMSDHEFVDMWQNSLSRPCVVLFEDFDTVFNGRESLTAHKTLTFDCVLNQISGVNTIDGIYLIVTTNKLESIDPAMGVVTEHGSISSRPGRIDNVLYLGEASESVRRGIATHILRDWPDAVETLVAEGKGYVAAQFQELCVNYAYRRMSQPNTGTEIQRGLELTEFVHQDFKQKTEQLLAETNKTKTTQSTVNGDLNVDFDFGKFATEHGVYQSYGRSPKNVPVTIDRG